MSDRVCGQCTVCCTALAVDELGKPKDTACYHAAVPGRKAWRAPWPARAVSRGGCSIYDERPTSCRMFACLWLLGAGKPRHRPDRCGVLLEPQQTSLGATVVVRELSPNALLFHESLLRMLRRAKTGLYIKGHDGTTSIEGPPEFIEQASAMASAHEIPSERLRLRVLK